MRTSDEIYHRVRWDPRFDPARFVLGISRRGDGLTRIPLSSFALAGGRVHRRAAEHAGTGAGRFSRRPPGGRG
nr:DUF504 domain-containing protein [Streptomyces sp. NTH33]